MVSGLAHQPLIFLDVDGPLITFAPRTASQERPSSTGASLADLMARMGHASTRAALIYQHTAREQDKGIADALDAHITRERDRAPNGHEKRKNRR